MKLFSDTRDIPAGGNLTDLVNMLVFFWSDARWKNCHMSTFVTNFMQHFEHFNAFKHNFGSIGVHQNSNIQKVLMQSLF